MAGNAIKRPRHEQATRRLDSTQIWHKMASRARYSDRCLAKYNESAPLAMESASCSLRYAKIR